MAHPLWARAPLVLRRWPALLAALAGGALLLGVTVASPPLFLSSSATDALDRSIRESTRYAAGVAIALHDARRDVLPGDEAPVSTVATRDEVLGRATAAIPYLDHRILTILSESVPVASARVDSSRANPVRIVHRTEFAEHLRVIEGEPRVHPRDRHGSAGGRTAVAFGSGGMSSDDRGVLGGAWIQDVTANALRVGPGDTIILQPTPEQEVRVRVAGVYEALANSPPDPYWEPLADAFRPPTIDAPLPPPFVLVDGQSIETILDRLNQRAADFQWEFPLSLSRPLDLSSGTELAARFRALGATLQDTRSPSGRYFRCTTCPEPTPIRLDVRSTLEDDLRRARETTDSLRPSIDLLAVAGVLTALLVLGTAGLYSVNRRRTEYRLLASRGMAPTTLGAKAALESVVPIAGGAALGFALSAVALARLGPGAKLDPAALGDAARATAVMAPVALVVIGMVATISSFRLSPGSAPSRRAVRVPWEIPVLVAAGVALQRVLEGSALVEDESTSVARVSAWLLVFPVLFVAGGAGLVARAFRRALVFVRARERRLGSASFLALNRLASARWLALMLITASSLALGVFLFAQAMAESVRQTAIAKSYIFTGSDVSVPVDRQYVPPATFELPYTLVNSKIDAGRLQPSNETFDALAIDVDSFEGAAYWDESFSDEPLGSLLRKLDTPADGTLRVIVAGRLPPGTTIEVGGVPIPYEVVARVDAFPGQFLDRTLLISNRDTTRAVIEAAGGLDPVTAGGSSASLWVRGTPRRVANSLAELGFGPDDSLSAEAVLQNPAFIAVTRTFGFLKALGALSGLLVLVGIVLYVQTKQRGRSVAYALARKMGLRSGWHFVALVLELGAMLVLSMVVGFMLGGVSVSLVYDRVDLFPNIPPHPLLRIPLSTAVPVGIALTVATATGAWRAHRSAERADVVEALRSGA